MFTLLLFLLPPIKLVVLQFATGTLGVAGVGEQVTCATCANTAGTVVTFIGCLPVVTAPVVIHIDGTGAGENVGTVGANGD